MARRRTIEGVLYNFLGTYTSRYSDYEGYWLFGFIVESTPQLTLDLVVATTESTAAAPLIAASRLAAAKFAEQIRKAGLSMQEIRSSHLDIKRAEFPREGRVNGFGCPGYDVNFAARAVSDRGRTYKSERSLFIAPHNPEVERGRAIGP